MAVFASVIRFRAEWVSVPATLVPGPPLRVPENMRLYQRRQHFNLLFQCLSPIKVDRVAQPEMPAIIDPEEQRGNNGCTCSTRQLGRTRRHRKILAEKACRNPAAFAGLIHEDENNPAAPQCPNHSAKPC